MFKSFNRRDFSILLGNLLDHFDSALYGFLAPIMAPVFFPNHDKINQLILAYSLFATSIFTRPIGAFIFGLFAKNHGAIKAMSYSLLGVATGSILVGIIPGHDIIGWKAALLLIIVRFIKGIFGAGENAIVKLYIIEDKNYRNSFKASYIYQASSIIGIILASSISTLVLISKYEYLWRFCFILGGSVGFVALILRKYSDFKPSINTALKTESINLWKAKYKLLSIALSTGLSHITYSIPCIVMNSLVPFITDISFETMMELNIFLLVFDMVLIFFVGPIMKNFDHIKIMIYSCAAIILTVPILIFFLPNSGILYVTFVRIWIITLGVIFMCPQNLFYKKLFDGQKDQYLVTGMANAVGAGTIGKLTPAFTLWLWHINQNLIYIGIFIAVIAILTAYTILLATKKLPL